MKKILNKYYIVKKNDNINSICNKYNINKQKLIQINYIKNEKIEIGDILLLEETSENPNIYHIVRPFDTIESIANKYNISPNKILEITNSKNIFIGQKIKIKQ